MLEGGGAYTESSGYDFDGDGIKNDEDGDGDDDNDGIHRDNLKTIVALGLWLSSILALMVRVP